MTELTHLNDQPASSLQAWQPDRERAMLALGFHPNHPLTHAAMLLANTYGLDPVLGHIRIIPGKGSQPATIWVTRDGYLFKAKQHPGWDGMDIVKEDDGGGPPDGVYFIEVVVRRKGQPDQTGRAWYRWRQSKGSGGTYIDENADEMCLQRAERRALRRQFPLSIFDDRLAGLIDDDGEPQPAPAPVVEVAGRVREQMHESSRHQSDPGAGLAPRPEASGSDTPASAAGQDGNDANQAGPEPPNAEVPTSPSPASLGDGDGKTGRRRRRVPTSAGKVGDDGDPAGPQQSALDDAGPEPPGWEQP